MKMFLILFLMCKIYCLPKKKIVKKENVSKSKKKKKIKLKLTIIISEMY